MRYISDSNYNHISILKIGVLIVNLGTPEAPTTSAVRRYLREFLSDGRVVEIPRLIWWILLNFIILPLRSPKSAKAYRKIWTKKGSPLLVNSINISSSVEKALERRWNNIIVKPAMRYGLPNIKQALEEMRKQNVRRLLVLPIFPQYSSSTSASVFESITRNLCKQRWLPDFHFVSSYHDHPLFIKACAQRIIEFNKTDDSSAKLVLSFHGLPKRNLLNGDPYHCQCHKTARLIAEELNLNDNQWIITFQSRFGKAEWLQPYTDKTLMELGKQAVPVNVFCPGFAADCLETLEEIAMQGRDIYLENGGTSFTYIPALNDSPMHTDSLEKIIEQHLLGWNDWNDDNINSPQIRLRQNQLAQNLKRNF